MRDTSKTIIQAMREGIHEQRQDFEDVRLPFVSSSLLQKCPGLSELRREVQGLIDQLGDLDRLSQLKALVEKGQTQSTVNTITELTKNTFGIFSSKPAQGFTTHRTAEQEYADAKAQFRTAKRAIGDAIIKYVHETFTPSTALVDIEHAFRYFSYKFSEAPNYVNYLEDEKRRAKSLPGLAENELIERANSSYRHDHSLFLSGLIGVIARINIPQTEQTLTSPDKAFTVKMGTVSPILFSLKATAAEYATQAYHHRRPLLANAFLSALAIEEERVARHYKLLVGEVQNALGLRLPKNWINSCSNAAYGDLWTEQRSIALIRGVFGLQPLEENF
jgi:hypothetical protein